VRGLWWPRPGRWPRGLPVRLAWGLGRFANIRRGHCRGDNPDGHGKGGQRAWFITGLAVLWVRVFVRIESPGDGGGFRTLPFAKVSRSAHGAISRLRRSLAKFGSSDLWLVSVHVMPAGSLSQVIAPTDCVWP